MENDEILRGQAERETGVAERFERQAQPICEVSFVKTADDAQVITRTARGTLLQN